MEPQSVHRRLDRRGAGGQVLVVPVDDIAVWHRPIGADRVIVEITDTEPGVRDRAANSANQPAPAASRAGTIEGSARQVPLEIGELTTHRPGGVHQDIDVGGGHACPETEGIRGRRTAEFQGVVEATLYAGAPRIRRVVVGHIRHPVTVAVREHR
jgi:hypothetical protein